ncbi:MAG: hypothetical protein AVDCRST_MAG68-5067 [uncultured Gemmatimonadetes bacterium]|uniref:Uncharacterized protein n=1 Tax=uncultured Gemmatimonadota bacterium TaxID=203437 RepID=A0A6J4MP07_9BACT|nr:MAG: hypothetical protein AVDCRST_MAG68-5067 [uncultured Gemmatimonadota bacterium]
MIAGLRRLAFHELRGVLQRWSDPQRQFRDHASELSRRQAILHGHQQRDADEEVYQQGRALIERDEADRERRDDLARDVAREWARMGQRERLRAALVEPSFVGALDRLLLAYLPDDPK